MKNNILNKLITILEKRGPIRLEYNEKIENFNFLETGLIDSIGLIKFIFEIEDKFNITLNEKDTTSEDFGIIKGLVKIIECKLKK